jgi:preprotein translocase subunit YajC
MFSTPAFAQAVGAAATKQGPLEIIMGLLPMVAIMVVFYFLLLRPQQQRMKAHQQMLSELKKGDTVVAAGGLIGKVKTISEQEVSIELAPNLVVKVVRSAIAEVRGPQILPPANDAKA